MSDKIPSAITNISLNGEATFHGQAFSPTYINFLFGNNGTGKSTIAKNIKEKRGLTWETGRTADDYTLLVYNEDFIKRNIASYGGMPGVFTISEQNAEIQAQIEEATSQLGTAQSALKQAAESLGKQEELLKNQYDTFQNICWEKTKDFRKAAEAALSGKKTKDGFTKALLFETAPAEFDENNLIAMCEAAFDDDADTYPELFTGDPSTLEDSPLLSKKIMSSADSPFATFMKAIGATNWVRQGHEELHEAADGKCPYCQKPLNADFEEELAKCFDEQYESDLAALRAYKAAYGNAANAIWRGFAANLKNAYPKIEAALKSFSALFDTFKAKMQLNAQRLDEKIAAPDKVIELEDLSGIISQLNEMVESMNKQIRENNAIVNDRTKKQPQCKADVMHYLSFVLSDEII